MQPRDRTEMVNLVIDGILSQCKDAFPRKIRIDPDPIGDACAIAFEEAVDAYNPDRKTRIYEKAFGEDFGTIVRASVLWLTEEGYLQSSVPSEVFGTTFTLSERGARLVDCLPNVFKV